MIKGEVATADKIMYERKEGCKCMCGMYVEGGRYVTECRVRCMNGRWDTDGDTTGLPVYIIGIERRDGRLESVRYE